MLARLLFLLLAACVAACVAVADYGVHSPAGYNPQVPDYRLVAGASGNIKRLSKVPVLGKMAYNPAQRQYHNSLKVEKEQLRRAKYNYEAALAAAPKVPGRPHLRKSKRDGMASRLLTDQVIMSNDDIVRHNQNVRLYKNLIKNKPVLVRNTAPARIPQYY